MVPERCPLHSESDGITVTTVLADFWRHAEAYYRTPDGTATGEIENYRQCLRVLRRLFGNTPAAEFGPKSLKSVRQEMIRMGWSRTYINRQVNRLKHVFKWATEEELVPATVYHGLQAVSGLRAGRSDAKESEPVTAVPEEHVRAVLPHVSSVVATMIEVQLLTGMRPGEVCAMRACDIDRTGPLWIYRPPYHKTLHHGHARGHRHPVFVQNQWLDAHRFDHVLDELVIAGCSELISRDLIDHLFDLRRMRGKDLMHAMTSRCMLLALFGKLA